MGRGRRIVTGIACCALLALAASPALAATKKGGKQRLGSVSTAEASSTAPGIAQISATATCPGRKRAIAGGFATSTTGSSSFIAVHTSVRSSPRTWTNTGISTPSQTLTSYVYCRRLSKRLSDTAVNVSLPARTADAQPTATAVAACPGKRTAVSGGFSSTIGAEAEDFAYPYSSLGDGESWTVSGANNSTSAQTLTGHAYCAKGLQGPDFTTGSNSSGSEPSGGSVSTASAECSKGKLSAGGFNGSVPTAGGPLPVVTQNRLLGTEWRVTSVNLGATGLISLEAQGACL